MQTNTFAPSRFISNRFSNKMLVMVGILIFAISQHTYAQDGTKPSTSLLSNYYQLKDALVSSNATLAAENARGLVAAINETGKAVLSEKARPALLKDATAIAQSRDLAKQREKFAALSNSMADLAKTTKLDTTPVYQQYCPMKKASWLSSEKDIKNPYYGNAMLTCGSVNATF